MQLQLFKGTISKDSQKNSMSLGQVGRIFSGGGILAMGLNLHNMDFFLKETNEPFRLTTLLIDYVLLEGDKVAFYATHTKTGFYYVVALKNFTRNYTKKVPIFLPRLYGIFFSCMLSFIITVIFVVATKPEEIYGCFIVFIICFMIIFFPFAKKCKEYKRINTTLLNMQESSLNE